MTKVTHQYEPHDAPDPMMTDFYCLLAAAVVIALVILALGVAL